MLAAASWQALTRARADVVAATQPLESLDANPKRLLEPAERRSALDALQDADQRIARAQRTLSRSVPLRVVGSVPPFRSQRSGGLELISDARSALNVATAVLGEVDERAGRLTIRDGALPLGEVQALEGTFRQGQRDLEEAQRDGGGLWGPLARQRTRFNSFADDAARRLGGAADGAAVARALLGQDSNRRFLLAAQNNAEMRDQGMILSYAIVGATKGRMTVEHTGPIRELRLDQPADVQIPPGTQRLFGYLLPTRLWQNVNATADFSWTGQAASSMFRQATGTAVDGVVALDVPALARILAVTGPLRVPGVAGQITAKNAGDVLLRDLYESFPVGEQGERKELLGAVFGAVVERLTTEPVDPLALGEALADAASGGHVRMWSADASEQARIESMGLSAGPGRTNPERTIHVAVQNASKTKLDYFVRPEVTVDVTLTAQGTAVVRTTVDVVNTAPANAAASYQFGPGDEKSAPGEYIGQVYFWGPTAGSQLGAFEESGLQVSDALVAVRAGARSTVTFETVLRDAVQNGRLALRFVPQPRLHPVKLRVRLNAPGWSVTGEATREQRWSKTVTTAWNVSR